MSSPWALVTGASSGLGAEYARQLAARGHSIVLVARDRDRLEALASELSLLGVETQVMTVDLHKASDVEAVAQRLRDTEHPVRMLVNNAGYGIHGTLATSELQEERDHLAIHVCTPMELMKAALPGMLARGEGRIILVSSVAGYLARGTYSANKAWGLTMARSLNASHKKQGVHVSAVAPGFTRTEFHHRMKMKVGLFPRFLWLAAPAVVKNSLQAVEAGRAITIPSLRYKVLVVISSLVPAKVHQVGA
jgi:short-subunit dehydrogenase